MKSHEIILSTISNILSVLISQNQWLANIGALGRALDINFTNKNTLGKALETNFTKKSHIE